MDSFAGRTSTMGWRSTTLSSRRKVHENRNRLKRRPERNQKALEASYLLTTSEHKLIYSLLSLNSTFSNKKRPIDMGMICSWYVNGKLLKTKTYPDLKAFHGHAVRWRLLRSRTFPLGPLMAWQSFKSANLQKLPYRQSRKHFPKLRRPPKYRIMS